MQAAFDIFVGVLMASGFAALMFNVLRPIQYSEEKTIEPDYNLIRQLEKDNARPLADLIKDAERRVLRENYVPKTIDEPCTCAYIETEDYRSIKIYHSCRKHWEEK